MDSFRIYFSDGLWIVIQSLIPAVIIFALINLLLYFFKKRDADFFKNNKLKVAAECLFVISLYVILKITGITDGSYYLDGFVRISSIEIGIPFCGASELMVFMNTFMFVPFGFFAAMAFKKLSLLKAFLISFGTTFLIEFLQLFNGRKTELDDIIANVFGAMCGYFIFRGIEAVIKKDTRKKGVITLVSVLICGSLYAVTVHCLADGDRAQAEAYAMCHEIDSSEDEYEYISKMTYYENGKEYPLDCENREIKCMNIYSLFGIDISIQVSCYTESTRQGNICDVINENPADYLMIDYNEPQYFNFYNNENLVIDYAETLLYNLDDCTLYYSQENSDEYIVWTLDTSKMSYAFEKDENLCDTILNMIK